MSIHESILIEGVLDAIIAILLASAGGLAQLLNGKDNNKLTWDLMFSKIFVASFCGVMTLMLTRASGISGSWVGLACGVAGWTSPQVLFALTRMTEKLLKIEDDTLKNRRD